MNINMAIWPFNSFLHNYLNKYHCQVKNREIIKIKNHEKKKIKNCDIIQLRNRDNVIL